MKISKSIAYSVTFMTLLSCSASIMPGKVMADEIHSSEVTRITKPNQEWSKDKIESLVDQLQKNYSDLGRSYLKKMVVAQLNGDYKIPPLENATSTSPFVSFPVQGGWKGITVSQMGAAIDTAISIALGGIATAGIKAALGSMSKSAAKSVVKKAVIKVLGSSVPATAIEYALNYASPGYQIAKYWDEHDAYPNNGRINF